MKPRFIQLFLLIIFSFQSSAFYGAVDIDTLRSTTAMRVVKAPSIDGKLNEAEWSLATATSGFVQFRPDEGKPGTQITEVKIIYTDFAIYVGAYCYDTNPDSILKQLGKRDDENLNSDLFTIRIDPYNNQQDAFNFGVYASGVQMDSKFSDYTFDAVWNSDVSFDEKGWYVEMEIPFSAFRFPATPIQLWGLQLNRGIRRIRESQMWAYVPSTATNFQLYWGHLRGVQDVKTPLRLSAVPYVALSYDHNPLINDDGSYTYSNLSSYNFGADIKYGIDDRFTLDMTLLPDFGQVQSDRIVKNLSYREVVYDENRPFFREATELFSKGDLFYSRRIGRVPGKYYSVFNEVGENENLVDNPAQAKLLNAVKISGRTDGGLGIGFFNAITDNAYATIENNSGGKRQVLTEPLTNYNVFVLDQQFKNNSNIYFINASTIRRDQYDDSNVSGAGIRLSNKKNTFVVAGDGVLTQRLSRDKEVEGNVFTNSIGYKYSLGAEKQGGIFNYGAYRNVTSNEYVATDLGFFRVAGQNNTEAFLKFSRFKPWKKIRESYNYLNVFVAEDFRTGKIGQNSIDLNLFANLLSWNAIFAGGGAQLIRPYDFYEARIPGQLFYGLRYYYGYVGFSTDYRKKLAIDYNFNISNFIDKYRWFGYNNSVSLLFRPSDKLFIRYQLRYDFDPFNVGFANFDQNGATVIGGRRLDTWENNLRVTYTFTNNMNLTMISRHYWITGQYKRYFSLDEGGEMLDNITYHQNNNFNFNVFNVDLIFEWIFSPGSRLNIVYKNNITSETGVVGHNFSNNMNSLIQDPQATTIAVKVLYFLDYIKVHGRLANRFHKSKSASRQQGPDTFITKRGY